MVNKICGKKQVETSLALNPFVNIEDDPLEEMKDDSAVLHDEKDKNPEKSNPN